MRIQLNLHTNAPAESNSLNQISDKLEEPLPAHNLLKRIWKYHPYSRNDA